MTINPRYSIKINGQDREILMSFGLLQALSKQIGHVTNIMVIPNILLDHDMYAAAQNEVLAERKPSGKVISYIDIEDADFDISEMDDLMKWVVEHLTDFFINRLQKFSEVTENLKGKKEKKTS